MESDTAQTTATDTTFKTESTGLLSANKLVLTENSDGTFSFQSSLTGYYLRMPSSGNNVTVKSQTTIDSSAKWVITVSNNMWCIQNSKYSNYLGENYYLTA